MTNARFRIITSCSFAVLASIIAGPSFASTVVVTANQPDGWAFSNQDNASHNASGQFEAGPATPPLGSGSAQLVVNDSASSEILISAFGAGSSASAFTTLSYSTYVTTSTNGSGAAPTLQFDLHNAAGAFAGRLVFDPGLLGTVTDDTWQTWNAETAQAWYFTGAPQSGQCSIAGSYCTLAQAAADISGFSTLDVLFKAGSGQSSFDVNVDDFTIGINGSDTTFDFEAAAVPEASTLAVFGVGLAGLGWQRRRSHAQR
jgi:hypothetical protein